MVNVFRNGIDSLHRTQIAQAMTRRVNWECALQITMLRLWRAMNQV